MAGFDIRGIRPRRRRRLLERLKDRRWAEWRSAVDKELEGLSAEAYLARWNHERSL